MRDLETYRLFIQFPSIDIDENISKLEELLLDHWKGRITKLENKNQVCYIDLKVCKSGHPDHDECTDFLFETQDLVLEKGFMACVFSSYPKDDLSNMFDMDGDMNMVFWEELKPLKETV